MALELLGKARALLGARKEPVRAVVAGENALDCAREMCYWGADEVLLYDSPEFSVFRADAYADALEDAILAYKPAAVLVGATALGRSLAPRVAARLKTGLTADCTGLELREDGGLVPDPARLWRRHHGANRHAAHAAAVRHGALPRDGGPAAHG